MERKHTHTDREREREPGHTHTTCVGLCADFPVFVPVKILFYIINCSDMVSQPTTPTHPHTNEHVETHCI